MKRIFSLLFAVLLGSIAMYAQADVAGVMTAAVVLPAQKIVFMNSLREEYKALDTWLNEATDLSSFVADGQTLRFPEAGGAPAVYKNRTTDVDSVEVEETIFDVALDYYDSQNYKMRNINMHALPYEKIQYYTKKSAEAIVIKEVQDAAYAFAPINVGGKRIIIPTTGAARNGFKMLTLSDILILARACDAAGFPKMGRNLVLPSDMWWDLVENNDILKAQLQYQQNTGIINPSIINYYGFKIHNSFGNNAAVAYDISDAAKAPQGAVITGDVVPAAFVFISSEVFRAGGAFEMFMTEKSKNPTGRADEFGFAHRFKADFDKSGKRYSAMIYKALA
jgi:hypothetical protein